MANQNFLAPPTFHSIVSIHPLLALSLLVCLDFYWYQLLPSHAKLSGNANKLLISNGLAKSARKSDEYHFADTLWSPWYLHRQNQTITLHHQKT